MIDATDWLGVMWWNVMDDYCTYNIVDGWEKNGTCALLISLLYKREASLVTARKYGGRVSVVLSALVPHGRGWFLVDARSNRRDIYLTNVYARTEEKERICQSQDQFL